MSRPGRLLAVAGEDRRRSGYAPDQMYPDRPLDTDYAFDQFCRLRAAHTRLRRDPQRLRLPHQAQVTGGAWPGREYAQAALELTFGLESLNELGIGVRDL